MPILSSDVPTAWRRLNPLVFAGELKARAALGIILLVLGLGAALAYLHLTTHKYTAELIIIPAEQPVSGLPGSVSGLGSLVGLDLEQDSLSFALYGEALATGQVAAAISKDERILRGTFPAHWDTATGQWREPTGIVRTVGRMAKRLLGLPVEPWHVPDATDVRLYIQKQVKVAEEKRRPVIRMAYEHEDPEFARYFLGAVSAEADKFLRAQSITRTSAYIDYLEKRMATVTISEQRQSLAQLISTYEKSRMMASSGATFAADNFGEISVGRKPTSPNVPLVLGIAVAAALFLWIAVTAVLVLRSPQ